MSNPDWIQRTLEDVATFEYGEALPAGARAGSDFPVFGSNGEVGRHGAPLVSGPGIIVGRKGTVGAVVWSPTDFWPIDTTYYVQARSGIDRRWLYWAMSALGLRHLDSSTGVPGLNRNDAYELPINVPPLGEQQRVALVLDAADGQIRFTASVLSKLRAARYGLADHLLSAGIGRDGQVRDHRERPSDFRETALGLRPRNWISAPLGAFIERSDYGISTPLSSTGRVPVLRMNNFAGGEAKLDDLKYSSSAGAARLNLSEGDVLFNRTNSMEHVGRTGIWRGQLELASFASYLVRLVPNEKLTSEYLNRLLNLRRSQIDLRRWATPGVHQVNVNPSNLRRVVVVVPESLDEQQRICEVLAHHDASIVRETKVLSKLRLQKAGLVADLLTGRVRVPGEMLA